MTRDDIEKGSNALGVILLLIVILVVTIGIPELERQGATVTTQNGRVVQVTAYYLPFLVLGGALLIGFLRGRIFAVLSVLGVIAFVFLALNM